jgi:hypothetical protein
VNDSSVWTVEQLDWFAAEWERKVRQGGPVRLLTPLPRRVRLRLAVTQITDNAAIWLAERGHYGAARLLWLAFGGWR